MIDARALCIAGTGRHQHSQVRLEAELAANGEPHFAEPLRPA